jgi:hypothetical protein
MDLDILRSLARDYEVVIAQIEAMRLLTQPSADFTTVRIA